MLAESDPRRDHCSPKRSSQGGGWRGTVRASTGVWGCVHPQYQPPATAGAGCESRRAPMPMSVPRWSSPLHSLWSEEDGVENEDGLRTRGSKRWAVDADGEAMMAEAVEQSLDH